MSKANKEKFLRFYPDMWDFDMAVKACEKGKITEEEFKEITGEDFIGEPYIQSSAYDAVVEQLAQSDEAAIELYEAQAEQEEINSAQDEALIELYEMIGG